jgi:hypothetical protein
MCSGYPRTKVLLIDAMASYQQQLRAEGLSPTNAAHEASRKFACDVVAALDEVRAMPPKLSPEMRVTVYEWMRHLPGETFAKTLTQGTLNDILSSKLSRGLL